MSEVHCLTIFNTTLLKLFHLVVYPGHYSMEDFTWKNFYYYQKITLLIFNIKLTLRLIMTSVPKKYFPLSGCTGNSRLNANFFYQAKLKKRLK